jgi:transcriptional regulator with XRE-family HTH domain
MSTEGSERKLICEALASEMAARGVTSEDVAKATGITASHIRKMANGSQEPKMSTLFRIEESMNWPRGVIARRLVDFADVEELIRTDNTLLPVFQQSVADNYVACQRISRNGD